MSLLTIDEAAARLAIHPKTLRKLVAEGKVPLARVRSRCHRFRVEDLDAYVETVTARVEPVADHRRRSSRLPKVPEFIT